MDSFVDERAEEMDGGCWLTGMSGGEGLDARPYIQKYGFVTSVINGCPVVMNRLTLDSSCQLQNAKASAFLGCGSRGSFCSRRWGYGSGIDV